MADKQLIAAIAAGGPLGDPAHVRVAVPPTEPNMARQERALGLAAAD